MAGLSRPYSLAVDDRAHALLGCGYPRMLVAIDEPVPELTDFETYRTRYQRALVIPRGLAPIQQAIEETDLHTPDEFEKSMRSPQPKPLGEAVKMAFTYGLQTMRQLEIVHGSVAVAEAAVKQLVAFPTIVWHGYDGLDEAVGIHNGQKGLERSGYSTIRHVGNMLWRVPAAVAKRLRAELVELLEKKARDPEGRLWRAAKALDVILNGRAGVERSEFNTHGNTHLSDLVFAPDDPDWVTAMIVARLAKARPADREFFDIQLAVAGGEPALAALRKYVAVFPKDQAKAIEEQLSLCA